jgi:hypothetical protein
MKTYSPTPRDIDILKPLAGRLGERASRPEEAEKRARWTLHNDLTPTTPLIFCDPENGWNEIITPAQLSCEGALARNWEFGLRKRLFWAGQMGDDRVTEPFFDVSHVHTRSDWGMHEVTTGGQDGGSYVWDAPLKSYDDLDKLRFPEISVDAEATQELLALAQNTFAGLLEVRLRTGWQWSLGLTQPFIKLRGLEAMMMDMYDEPENLKRLMAFIRDGHLSQLDFLEKNGLLAPNADGTYVGSGGFGFTRQLPAPGYDPGHVRTLDRWGFCESQETVSVSPEMFAEFVHPYELPQLERFGLNCYGCCEPVDSRWHILKDIPRLRRVSVSPWANAEKMAGFLGDRYVFSAKPNPAYIAVPELDETVVRADLRRLIEPAYRHHCHLELIMKDNHTLGGNPMNAVNWCRIAREEIRRVWN